MTIKALLSAPHPLGAIKKNSCIDDANRASFEPTDTEMAKSGHFSIMLNTNRSLGHIVKCHPRWQGKRHWLLNEIDVTSVTSDVTSRYASYSIILQGRKAAM